MKHTHLHKLKPHIIGDEYHNQRIQQSVFVHKHTLIIIITEAIVEIPKTSIQLQERIKYEVKDKHLYTKLVIVLSFTHRHFRSFYTKNQILMKLSMRNSTFRVGFDLVGFVAFYHEPGYKLYIGFIIT